MKLRSFTQLPFIFKNLLILNKNEIKKLLNFNHLDERFNDQFEVVFIVNQTNN